MSAEYTNNHHVPQWYQRQFIPAHQADRELYLLDLKPESFRDGRGIRRQRKALRRTGPRKCFAIDDLYTTRFGGIESRELERVFFGEVDTRGKAAVEFFAGFDHDRVSGEALEDLMIYLSTQSSGRRRAWTGSSPRPESGIAKTCSINSRGFGRSTVRSGRVRLADRRRRGVAYQVHRLRSPGHRLQPLMRSGPPLVQARQRPGHPPAGHPHALRSDAVNAC